LILNPEPLTLNPRLQTLNPTSYILNPKPPSSSSGVVGAGEDASAAPVAITFEMTEYDWTLNGKV